MGYVNLEPSLFPTPILTVRNNDQNMKTNNPTFLKWVHTDQLIMAWLIESLTVDALISVKKIGFL